MTRILINITVSALVILSMLTFENKPYFLSLEILEQAELFAYDFRMRANLKESTELDKNIVIVDIDQQSIEEHGYWPWRRDKIAELIFQLRNDYRAKLIVLTDSFAPESDQVENVLQDLKDRFYYDKAIQKAIEQIEPEYNFDIKLRKEIDGRQIVLGYEFDLTQRQIGSLPNIIDQRDFEGNILPRKKLRPATTTWTSYSGYIGNDEQFLSRSLSSGFANLILDSDGQIRSYKLLANYGGQSYYSLPLNILRYIKNIANPEEIIVDISPTITRIGTSVKKVGVKSNTFNVDRSGNLLLKYVGTGGSPYSEGGSKPVFEYFSAYEVFNGFLDLNKLQDKIVFVGSSSEVLDRLKPTPVNTRMPEIEIHALALKNILDGTVFVQPQYAWLVEGILLILIGLIFSILYPKLKLVLTLSITGIAIFATIYINYNIFWVDLNQVYRVTPFIILFLVLMFVNVITGLVVEYQQKRKVEDVLNQYIPPELAKEVNNSKKGFSMEGEIRDMSILFSDVRGFTSISEKLKPHDLTKFMNQMLTELSTQIHLNRGTIDKFIGDAVMAFWNAPLDDANHATNAVKGAIGMQVAITELSKKLVSQGMPEMKMGVGVNTGEACVGNMGSNIRLSYTVMGDTVNLASRLEGITKQYGVGIIVGDRTYELTKKDFLYRPVDSVRVKGKKQAVRIFEPICQKGAANSKQVKLQESCFEYWDLYQHRRFEEVVTIISELLQYYPSDNLLRIHLERANHFLAAPPADDWDAVTTFDTK